MGVLSQIKHSVVGVNTTTTSVLTRNEARQYVRFINDSDTVIYLSLGQNAAVNSGIRIEANGGIFELSCKNGNLYKGDVNVIHASTGTKNLLVTEGY